jgi:hypothetical protein
MTSKEQTPPLARYLPTCPGDSPKRNGEPTVRTARAGETGAHMDVGRRNQSPTLGWVIFSTGVRAAIVSPPRAPAPATGYGEAGHRGSVDTPAIGCSAAQRWDEMSTRQRQHECGHAGSGRGIRGVDRLPGGWLAGIYTVHRAVSHARTGWASTLHVL